MKSILNKLHAKLGDFWWYSLMLFSAQRLSDCMNVFVGLYLVPMYVTPAELGAVMPLSQFAGCLALPISVFALTFRNEITNLASANEFGKLKTLLCGTLIATGLFTALAFAICAFVLPAFLERMRLAQGSLGILIVALAFVSSVSPIFNNALQALKKFKACSIIGILGAPIRLISMLIVLPLRPISGYFAGQTSTPTFGIIASIFALRKELTVRAEPYWDTTVFRRVARFATLATMSAIACGLWSLASSTILRQRLPELDSAAYYMASRFSEISTFLTTTLTFTMFPFTAELARQGKSTSPLVVKASLAMILFCIPLATIVWLWGAPILGFLPHGSEYAAYYWVIPWLIGITCLNSIGSFYCNTELSAERFGYLYWAIPLYLSFAILMLGITAHGYFTAYLPASITEFLNTHNITSIRAYLLWITAFETTRVICSVFHMYRSAKKISSAN